MSLPCHAPCLLSDRRVVRQLEWSVRCVCPAAIQDRAPLRQERQLAASLDVLDALHREVGAGRQLSVDEVEAMIESAYRQRGAGPPGGGLTAGDLADYAVRVRRSPMIVFLKLARLRRSLGL